MAHLDFKTFNAASWNIQSVKDKLSDRNMKKLLDKYDLIFLAEIKTSAKISCTGYKVYQHSAKKGHRGGVALLVKPWLARFLRKVDKSFENVMVCEFDLMPDIVFVGCYNSPSDSPYYDSAIFGYLQGLMRDNEGKKFVIMGDLNSRVGVPPSIRKDDDVLDYVGCEDAAVVNTLSKGSKRIFSR